MKGSAMAKGQKKSNREAKKPKKSETEKLKANAPLSNFQTLNVANKGPTKK
jgi:hypothetical protein